MSNQTTSAGKTVQSADITSLLSDPTHSTIPWSCASGDLNANIIVWEEGQSTPEHVNDSRDVLYVCLSGQGELVTPDETIPLKAGTVILIPKGTSRQFRCLTAPFSYVTCHRRNPGLWPEGTAPEL